MVALALLETDATTACWAGGNHNLGVVYLTMLSKAQATNPSEILDSAYSCFKNALTVRTTSNSPFDWAMPQDCLGVTLQKIGDISVGSDKSNYFDRSEACHNLALTIFSEHQHPINWEMTQNNLGNLYVSQGQLMRPTEAAKKYRAAIDLFNRALAQQKNSGMVHAQEMTMANLNHVQSLLDQNSVN